MMEEMYISPLEMVIAQLDWAVEYTDCISAEE